MIMPQKRIIYAVLNWGLGHATRSLPLIRELIRQGNEVTLASTGTALYFLKSEFPQCEVLDIPDYHIHYTKHSLWLIPSLLFQMPHIFSSISRERRVVSRYIKTHPQDLIISDNCYGVHHRKTASVFITNQLRFSLPKGLGWAACVSSWFNRIVFRHYDAVMIPDAEGEPNMSGDLSHKGRIRHHKKLNYIGPMSSIDVLESAAAEDIDILASVSGPEPQRTLFEKQLRDILPQLGGKKICLLGKPDKEVEPESYENGDLLYYSHLDRKKMSQIMRRAKFVVSRSGNSTSMELMALKKPALLIPTPGQTEQEYLARFYNEQSLFYTCKQSELTADVLKKAMRQDYKPVDLPVNELTDAMKLLDDLCT